MTRNGKNAGFSARKPLIGVNSPVRSSLWRCQVGAIRRHIAAAVSGFDAFRGDAGRRPSGELPWRGARGPAVSSAPAANLI